MRIFFVILMFAIGINGYCSAAHAFGEIPMKKAESSAMSDMPDCPFMNDAFSKKSSAPTGKSSNISCKACCASLVGMIPEFVKTPISLEYLRTASVDSASANELFFPIFHPPKSN